MPALNSYGRQAESKAVLKGAYIEAYRQRSFKVPFMRRPLASGSFHRAANGMMVYEQHKDSIQTRRGEGESMSGQASTPARQWILFEKTRMM